jgi:sulfotransferase
MGGLSRSGSTLLSAILHQNPNIHVSENSPVCDLTYKLNLLFDHNPQYNAAPNEARRINVLRSLIDNYYYDVDKPIIIDKFRSWGTPYNISMIESLYTENVKIICPVRDVLEILTSFITLLENNKNNISFVDRIIKEKNLYTEKKDLNDIRCEVLMNMDGGIEHQLYAIEESISEKNKNYFHLVEYDDLISNPKNEINKIYNFLGVDEFEHNFDCVNYTESSRDISYYGIANLHKVRQKISKTSKNPKKVLSDKVIKEYSNKEFWRVKEAFK